MTKTVSWLAMASALSCAGVAQAGSFEFTDTADWNTGTFASTNAGPPDFDQVQLNPNIVTRFNYIWVALSGRDSAVRINTDHVDADGVSTTADSAAGNGAVFGEYRTAPSGQPGNPSRTTVDLNGDVWIGNRNATSGQGSAVKISATPGAGPTSTGVWNGSTFDRLAWSNAGGADTNGGTSTAEDVAIDLYIRTPSTGNRTIAIDANNDVWIGGLNNRLHAKYDGDTGAQIGGTNTAAVGGYGGVIDGNGILWSSDWSNSRIGRYDTNAADPATAYLGAVATGGPSYGLAVDNDGNIWNSHYDNGTVSKLNAAGVLQATYSLGLGSFTNSRGVAVTPDNNIWVASSARDTVTRLDSNGNVLAQIAVGDYPTGVSVDSNGKVWVTNQANTAAGNSVMRIDPATNLVDLKVELGPNATPYNYSDMTGSVVSGITNPTGSWVSGAIDGGINASWDRIFWNTEAEGTIPIGSTLDVQVRVADTIAGLSGLAWTSYASGDLLGLTGQFAQLRALFTRPGGTGALSPILSDITLTTRTNVVPLPASWLLFVSGLAGFGFLGRSRRRTAAA